MARKYLKPLALVLALMMLFSACGGSSAKTEESAQPAEQAQTETKTETKTE